MLDKRKLNQIENDDWNNSNDSESEIVAVKKELLKNEAQRYWWMQDRF